MSLNNKRLAALIGCLFIAYGAITGCGRKLKPNEGGTASSGGGGLPSAYDSSTPSGTSNGASSSSNNAQRHGCQYPSSGNPTSCVEKDNIVSQANCNNYETFADSCPLTGLVATCSIKDTYGSVIKINYEYTGTLQDAQLYTTIGTGETLSCIGP